MSGDGPGRWLRDARRAVARMPSIRPVGRVPEAPALPVRDPWAGDAGRGAKLLREEFSAGGGTLQLNAALSGQAGHCDGKADPVVAACALGFSWLRDLRALGTDAARMRGRTLVAAALAAGHDPLAQRPDVVGARMMAWLSHYDFFAASADDGFRHRLMGRIVLDARTLSAAMPPELADARALTAIKGLIAAAVALPDQAALMTRALKFLPQEIGRQILPDGSHCERSPGALLDALRDLIEMRAMLQAAQVLPPAALGPTIERMGAAVRVLRHGDGGLALFNGATEHAAVTIDAVLAQAGRAMRSAAGLPDGAFQRLQAGRSCLIVDCGAPPPAGLDRTAHAGTLSMEFSVGRDRVVVNAGAVPGGGARWYEALRATAAHSTLTLADTSSSELRPQGLGRRPDRVEVQRQEANGAHWLEASHDGWRKPYGAVHRRRLYMAESGEDLRGEDSVEAATPQPYVIRFHLHPGVSASLQHDRDAVLLRLPSGGGWRLRADGGVLSIEESIYAGAGAPRRAEQVVVTCRQDAPQHVKWAITKIG